jgi:hypothetical protein
MGLDLYKPEYEQTVRARAQHSASVEQLVNDMGELVVYDQRRRDTFPVGPILYHVLLSWAHLLEPSQCNQAFHRDRCRLQDTRLRRPHPQCPFRFQKTRISIRRTLVPCTVL